MTIIKKLAIGTSVAIGIPILFLVGSFIYQYCSLYFISSNSVNFINDFENNNIPLLENMLSFRYEARGYIYEHRRIFKKDRSTQTVRIFRAKLDSTMNHIDSIIRVSSYSSKDPQSYASDYQELSDSTDLIEESLFFERVNKLKNKYRIHSFNRSIKGCLFGMQGEAIYYKWSDPISTDWRTKKHEYKEHWIIIKWM